MMSVDKDNEFELVKKLRKDIMELTGDSLNKNEIDSAWLSNIDRLCHKALNSDLRDFLQWDVILRTMVAGNAEFVPDELNFLKELPDWKNRWEKAIEESPVGNPTLYDDFPSSSGNLIHQAYHLAQFEKRTGIDISQAGVVFEFGGGYGSMCRLVHNLNFKGQYVIFDLAPLSALQRFFLNMNSISAISATTYFEENLKGVICVSDLLQLETILANVSDAIFIATWSLSESPLNLRQSIISLIKQFNAFLIAYQGLFGKVDNAEFFDTWMNTMKNVEWKSWKIPHIPNQLYKDNYYLMGKRIC